MQPYQKASEAIQKRSEKPLKVVGAAATTALAGGSIAGRVLPFLSEYIPEDTYQAVAEILKWLSGMEPGADYNVELFK